MSDSFEETPQKESHVEEDLSPDRHDDEDHEELVPAAAPAAVSEDPAPESQNTATTAQGTKQESPERHQNDYATSDTDLSSPEQAKHRSNQDESSTATAAKRAAAPPVGSATNAARSNGGASTPAGHSRPVNASQQDGSRYSPNRSLAGSRAEHSTGRHRAPLVASISYPPRQEGLTVADFLDPSKPLVKSTLPLTKPRGPSFAEETSADARKQTHAEKRMQTAIMSSQILAQRNNERKYLKAQYEFEREKKIAERAIYHKERCMQWAQRLGANPLGVDLVADNERIEEEAYIREKEERHRKAVAERRKQRIKRAIIVKALAEVPLLEKARKEKRDLVEGEKREKALRDVQRVEAIQQRKILDQELMVRERQAKLDQRMMTSNSAAAGGSDQRSQSAQSR